MGILDPEIEKSGYQGSIPKYTATRERVQIDDSNRRPGQGGRRYFSDVYYSPMAGVEQGTQSPTMIPRMSTREAEQAAGNQADAFRAAQAARFATPEAPRYTPPPPTPGAGSGYRGGRFSALTDAGPSVTEANFARGGIARQTMFAPTMSGRLLKNRRMGTPYNPRSRFARAYSSMAGNRGRNFGGLRGIRNMSAPNMFAGIPGMGGTAGGRTPRFAGGIGSIMDRINRSRQERLARQTPGRVFNPRMPGPSRRIPYEYKTGPQEANTPPKMSTPPRRSPGLFPPGVPPVGGNMQREKLESMYPELFDPTRNTTMPVTPRPVGRSYSDVVKAGYGGINPASGVVSGTPRAPDNVRDIQNMSGPDMFAGIPRRTPGAGSGYRGSPLRGMKRSMGRMGFAEGGIASTAPGQGYFLGGSTDGMADEVKANIDGVQEARLSDGEFVIPADVVSHLGNGNSEAGAKELHDMMDKVREERTGTKKQGKQINPKKMMPKKAKGGLASFQSGGEVQTGSESGLAPYVGDYVTDMLAKGAAAAEMPYQAYEGPLTAGASALQQQAFSGIGALQTPQNMGGQGFQTQSFTAADAQGLMNPYLQASLDPQLREARRQAEIQRIQDAGRLTKAGAFGGSRQAIMEAEGARNLLQRQADITAEGYNRAFDTARQQFNTEQDRNIAAQQAANRYGFDVLTAMRNAGQTQRDIEAEGIAADIAQFEQERDYPQKQIQYQKSLLEGLPVGSQQGQFMGPSDLAQLMGILSAGGSIYDMYQQYRGNDGGSSGGGGGGGDRFQYEDAFSTDDAFIDGDAEGNEAIYRDPMMNI